jgi:hypothetical protein
MKKYDVFKSQGGYGVAIGIYLDNPSVGAIRWFKSENEAKEYAKNRKAYDEAVFDWEWKKINDEYVYNFEGLPPNPKDYNLDVGEWI